MDLYEAVEYGELDQLNKWKIDGSLPDLMDDFDTSRTQWYPHEIAIRNGQFETLKWLVNESGQQIDLTVSDHRAIVVAASYERTDILKWLVLYSGQPVLVKLDEKDTDWYKSEHYNNHEIRTFLEAVNSLHVCGVSIEQIQRSPGMVQLVEAGRLSPEIVCKLTDDDIELALGAKAASASKITRRI